MKSVDDLLICVSSQQGDWTAAVLKSQQRQPNGSIAIDLFPREH